ncbi:MAG: IclR family transcriptional regulator [Parvibaculaceae bacterium]
MKRSAPTSGAEAGPDTVGLRMLRVLEQVAGSEKPLSISEIAEALELPRPTAHRICARLEELGYCMREPGQKLLAAGPRLQTLAISALRNDGRRSERRAILAALVEKVDETCNFTMLSGHEVLYIDRVEAHWPLRLQLEPGSRVPLHCTASGKLLLTFQSASRRKRLLAALDFRAHTPNSITSRKALEAEIEAIRRQGYSLDREEFLLGMAAIAAPVLNKRREAVAAIACHAPVARMSLEQAVRNLPAVQEAAEAIAATLSS